MQEDALRALKIMEHRKSDTVLVIIKWEKKL
ncbi:hypothetical protein bsdtw1_03953 [Clostridium fungisolvens]|uniref:Uncharacterized protein n=1 Tax=Clostridium fungisolvens TaxID=1604897 RepID=A0A6V8SM02_9CLOT|nr:hypothetical protein bsdtw1_03953 [Clostridium fungisolvens]